MSAAALPALPTDLAPNKRLGQHFLLDLNLCRKIAALSGAAPGETVIEVGPGPGGLTRALLERGLTVVAVERDPRFVPHLEELARAAAGRLRVILADALTVDEAAVAPVGAAIVANLPYNVGTPLLVKWLTGPFRPAAMTLMFQKEVAARITAPAGSPDYGRLAVLAQSLCAARRVLEVPARAFTPPPKVDSAVVRLTFKPDGPDAALVQDLILVARAAFGQRRKMLRSSLRALGGDALCARAGLSAEVRAETVEVADFLRLTRTWRSQDSHPSD